MKIIEMIKRGIINKIEDLKEWNIDVATLVAQQMFNDVKSMAWRDKAIDKLIKINVPFESNQEIIFDIVKRYLRIDCPYCKGKMKYKEANGNMDTTTIYFECIKCKSNSYLKLEHTSIGFTPKKYQDDEREKLFGKEKNK